MRDRTYVEIFDGVATNFYQYLFSDGETWEVYKGKDIDTSNKSGYCQAWFCCRPGSRTDFRRRSSLKAIKNVLGIYS
jgi:hypothetical protein